MARTKFSRIPSLTQRLDSRSGWDSIKRVRIDGHPVDRYRLQLGPEHRGMRLSQSMGSISATDVGRELVVDVYEDGSYIDVID